MGNSKTKTAAEVMDNGPSFMEGNCTALLRCETGE